MDLWLGITLILIATAGFLAYPFFFGRDTETSNSQSEQVNVEVFREQKTQYQQQFERGEISHQQQQMMVAEAEQLLLSNTSVAENKLENRQGLWLLPILVIIIPLATLWIYQGLGASIDEQIAEKLTQPATKESQATGSSQDWDAELVSLITERVKQRPNNVYYWTILAQEALSRRDLLAAERYLSQAIRLEPNESYLLGQYAQALFFIDANQFSEPVITALDNAFAVDSSNQTVLGLKGIQAFEAEDYKAAISYWQAATQRIDPNSGDWQALQSGIQKARKLMGDIATVQLSVGLSIDEKVTFSPDQMVFVAVIEADGPPMPIAARKLIASQLPINIVLSDNDALMAGRSLASVSKIRVIARLSTTGTATPESGDWEAISDVIEIAANPLSLELNIAQQRTQ